MASINRLSAKQLYQAAKLKDRIEGLEKKLAKLLGSNPDVAVELKPAKKLRRMSAAGRANMRAAAKARWAKVKSGKK